MSVTLLTPGDCPETCYPCEFDCTCITARNLLMASYTDLQYSNGPGSIGPMRNEVDSLQLCLDPAYVDLFAHYTFPGAATVTNAIPTGADPLCAITALREVCTPDLVIAGDWGWELCLGECVSNIFGQTKDGVFFAPFFHLGTDHDCPTDEIPIFYARAYIEWYCDESGNPHYDLYVIVEYIVIETRRLNSVGNPLGTDACAGVKMPTTLPSDGVDYTWSGNPLTTLVASRNDGKATITISKSSLGSGRHTVFVTASTYVTDTPTVDLWNEPFNPFGLLQGTASLV